MKRLARDGSRPVVALLGRSAANLRRALWARRREDQGASLVLAVIFMAVVAVVVAVVLSLTDTSFRTTLALREQAADAASTDGAAQIAINMLRRGNFDGTAGQCFGPNPGDGTVVLSDFYQGPTSATSAAVTCQLDPTVSGLGVALTSTNKPRNAVLTFDPPTPEAGVLYSDTLGRDLKIHGDVFTGADVDVPQGSLTVAGSLTARGNCTGTISSNPAPDCNIGNVVDPRGDDPDYPPPNDSTVVQPVPVCVIADQLVTFTPGRYTDVAGLNNLFRCTRGIFYFPPGTYYFDWGASTAWTVTNAYIVGGTPTTPLVAGVPPTMPGSCRSPVPPTPIGNWTPPPPHAGVTFVFGQEAHMVLQSARVELCGSYSTTYPPIAVYGLKTDVGPVIAQSGCITSTPYPNAGRCAVIQATGAINSMLYIQGTTYVPLSVLDISLNNTVGTAFAVGVIARSLRVTPTAAANLSAPMVDLPGDAPAGRRTVMYLNVYICEASSTCSPGSGFHVLRAKVGLLDPTGVAVPGARQVSIYSWSVLR